MKILVINAGSSSLKFQIINADNEEVIISGQFDGLNKHNASTCLRKYKLNGQKIKEEVEVITHKDAIENLLNLFLEKNVISSLDEIDYIGNRVVHGGEKYNGTVEITEDVIQTLKDLYKLAPLHNPANVTCIEILKEKLPNTKQYGVFDTAFHQTMPEKVYLYGLPKELYEKFGIRKYGFHGTSHKFVSKEAANILNKDYNNLKLITCHLGSGKSICAIKNGESFDTSMGFTPLEGLVMGTRSGSFDPEIILFLLDNGYTKEEIKTLINKKSGLLGLSNISNDHRFIEDESLKGNPAAVLTNDILANRITKIIGSYIAEMDGCDAIIFTGGIGENSADLRNLVLSHFNYLNIELDQEKNNKNEIIISTLNSKVTIMVVPTNEELQIVREIKEKI